MNQRRDNGTGSVSQRADGLWTGRIRIGLGSDGKQKVRAVYGKTEKEVKRKLRDLQREIDSGKIQNINKETVQTYMTHWLTETKRNELKPCSYDRLEQTLDLYIFPNIGSLQIGTITPRDVQALINTLRDRGLSYSTIKKAYDAVNSCFKNGMIQGTAACNPAMGVSLPRKASIPAKEMRCYSYEEAKKICTAATSKYGNGKSVFRLGDAIVVCLNTGLRVSELCGLKWEDVDFENKTLSVNSTIVVERIRDKNAKQRYHCVEQNETKSISSTRIVDLNDVAYDALCRVKEITDGERYVFATENHKPIQPRNVDRMLRKIVIRAGLGEDKQYGVHSLRHTFASMLFAAGTDVKTVSELLGHADTSVTFDTYIHLINGQKQRAINRIPTLF